MDRRPFLLALASGFAGCSGVEPGVLTEATDTPTPTGTAAPTPSATTTPSPSATATDTPTATAPTTPTARGDELATDISGYATDSTGPIALSVDIIRERLDGDKPAFLRVEIRNLGDEPVELAFDRSNPGPWLSAHDDPRGALVRDADGDDSVACWRLAWRPTQKTPAESGQTLDPDEGYIYGYELWGVPPADDEETADGEVPPGCLTAGTYSFGRQLTVDGGSAGIELDLAGS